MVSGRLAVTQGLGVVAMIGMTAHDKVLVTKSDVASWVAYQFQQLDPHHLAVQETQGHQADSYPTLNLKQKAPAFRLGLSVWVGLSRLLNP